MEVSISPKSNKLLELLPDQAYAQLRPHLALVQMPAGTILHEPGQAVRYAVFPVSGLVGRVALTLEGKSSELTTCGFDGMIGMSIILRGPPFNSRAMVLADMSAYRVPAPVLASAWRHSDAFREVLLSYMNAVMQELIQISVCNKHHNVEQRLSRWLLMAADRLGESGMPVTQSLIAYILGMRREGVTETAGRLAADGILRRERGRITIVDRKATQERCCECYGVIAGRFKRMASYATGSGNNTSSNTAAPKHRR